jgi:pilus assembly protein CpaB
MRPKSLLLLALALGCGLVASIGISQVMDRNSNRGKVGMETVPIYVAMHNINTGDPIDASMVSLQEWPKGKIPPGAISQLEDLEGRRPRTNIIQGEPLLELKLLAPGEVADPIRSIPKGYRLKTIAVDAEKSAAGLLGPGDRVDVQLYVRRDARNGIEFAKSKVILQNIRVFAVDQTVQRSPEGGEERTIAKTISLLLTPQQANKLTLAEHMGEVSLSPRHPDDDATADSSEYSADDLLSDGEKGSREKEQARERAEDENANGGLLNAIRQNLPPAKPPFVMEIVEAEVVREALFDADTGKPIRDSHAGPGPAKSGSKPKAGSNSPGDTSSSMTGEQSGPSLDDFPIPFD